MRLRNKQTGKIVSLEGELLFDDKVMLLKQYNSLAELNEEWEDCNGYYYIGDGGDVNLSRTKYRLEHEDEASKEIGNYFETKEEAEKAVEKLKAWKRLKDKGFRFEGWHSRLKNGATIYARYDEADGIVDALNMLFGGKG